LVRLDVGSQHRHDSPNLDNRGRVLACKTFSSKPMIPDNPETDGAGAMGAGIPFLQIEAPSKHLTI
jgi:hypothetical protein